MSTRERVDEVASAFRERAGRAPDGVWWAPGRVNLIGEHTDYNDGFVLPFAIQRGTLAAVARRDDDRLRCWSREEGGPEEAELAEIGAARRDGWAAYPQGVAWALREAGVAVAGADVVVESDVPSGSGLSSSAALLCAVGIALAELNDGRLARSAIARAAQRAENVVVGVPSGIMDQTASMLAREQHALFLDTRTLDAEQVPLEVEDRELQLVVINTRASRRLAAGAYAERRAACEEAARVLGVPALRDATPADVDAAAGALGDVVYRRARHVVTENARVLEAVSALRERDFGRLAPLLEGSHRSLRDDYEVSSPALDAAVEGARTGGALAARMTGAGFGGCAVALAPADRVRDVEREVRAAFAAAALGEPEVFPVAPADGARRLA